MITIHASKNGSLVRIGMWHGDVCNGKTPSINAAAEMTVEQAERLIARIREVIDSMPRVGTAADLGCEVL